MTREVPTLSLSDYTSGDPKAAERFGAALFEAFRDYGFAILNDHNVGEDLLEQAYGLSREFFAQGEAEKRKCESFQRGYTPFGTEHAKDAQIPDLKEFYQIGRPLPDGETGDDLFLPNVWPETPADFRPTFENLFSALDDTAQLCLAAIAPHLGVEADYFETIAGEGNSVLRVLHYPPVPDGVDPGAVRAAAHEDINLITILVAAKGAGLELLDRDGSWLAVETEPGNLIVDTGDMMQVLTNGVLPATTHRVVNPEGPNVSRYSMPFFMHPTPETLLDPLPACTPDGVKKFEPITAGDYLMQRLREIGLAK